MHDQEHEIEIVEAAAIEATVRGEVDMQVSTARRYPRSLSRFRADALDMVTLDADTAASCMYALKRGGKTIEGPSVRLAEMVASAWGNLRCQTRITSTEGGFVTAQAGAWDMERNVLISTEVKRRITDKNGRRYADDMIGVTANAASSIALRNAVFRVVPAVYVQQIYAAARETAVGNASTLVDRRGKAIGMLAKMGATEAQVCTMLGVGSVADIGLDELAVLRGIVTAIREGATTLDEALSPPKPDRGAASTDLRERMEAAKQADPTPAEAQAAGPVCPGCGASVADLDPGAQVWVAENGTCPACPKGGN